MLGGRCLEDRPVLGALIHPGEDQAVQVDVEIGRRAQSLDERDRAGVGYVPLQSALESRVLDQKGRDDPVNDLKYR